MVTNDVERIDYTTFDDKLDVYLHTTRYNKAIKAITWNSILDLWCWYWFGTKQMATACPEKQFIAIDIDPDVIAFAKQNNQLPNIDYRVMSATDLAFDNETFDTITSIENIEHIPEDQTYVAEAYRVLKNNGRFIISTPNDNRLWHRLKRLFWKKIVYNIFHIREYNLDQLRHTLHRHQFTVCYNKWLYINILPKSIWFTNRLRQKPFFYKWLVNNAHCDLASYMFIVAQKIKN